MNEAIEQRTNVKFLTKLGKDAQTIENMLKQVYGQNTMKSSTIRKWVKRFRDGRESCEDDPREGRPSTARTDENVARVLAAVRNDRRKEVRMIAGELGLPKSSVHNILTQNLGMKKVCAKIVPRVLMDEQKERRIACCQEWQSLGDDFLNHVITGDESWVYEYDLELKSQSREWRQEGEPRPKKARRSRSNIKTMAIVFFDIRGVVHHEYVPQGQTVNKEYYVEVLKRLRDRVRRARPEMFKEKSWILHHDNAPAHASLLVRQFLTRNAITVADHPPYSPDLAPCDFFLFPKVKKVLRGTHLDTVAECQASFTRELKALTPEAFKDCFSKWSARWGKCIEAEGEYFEGDHVIVSK